MHTTETRRAALAKHLHVPLSDIDTCGDDTCKFAHGLREYLVLTTTEADDRAAQYIMESAWSSSPEFLNSVTGLSTEVFEALQSSKYENNNKLYVNLICRTAGMAEYIRRSIAARGRSHFIAVGDGCEHAVNTGMQPSDPLLYVYCIG